MNISSEREFIVKLHVEIRGTRIAAAWGGVGVISQEPRNTCVMGLCSPIRPHGACQVTGSALHGRGTWLPDQCSDCSCHNKQMTSPSALALADSVFSYSWLQSSYGFHDQIAIAHWLLELSLALLSLPITEDAHFTSLDRFINTLHVLYETHGQIPKGWWALVPCALPPPRLINVVRCIPNVGCICS